MGQSNGVPAPADRAELTALADVTDVTDVTAPAEVVGVTGEMGFSRERRAELLALLPEAEAHALADGVLPYVSGDVSVIVPPTVGMLMARVADGAKGEQFNLAEILVTEARVSIDGVEGWGMVLGRSPEQALAVAVADAAAETCQVARQLVEETLTRFERERLAQQAHEWEQLAPTKVSFDVY